MQDVLSCFQHPSGNGTVSWVMDTETAGSLREPTPPFPRPLCEHHGRTWALNPLLLPGTLQAPRINRGILPNKLSGVVSAPRGPGVASPGQRTHSDCWPPGLLTFKCPRKMHNRFTKPHFTFLLNNHLVA